MATKRRLGTTDKKKRGKGTPPISTAMDTILRALPDSAAVRPDVAVSQVLGEARALEALLAKHGPDLERGAGLDRKVAADLGKRREALDLLESAWLTSRVVATPRSVGSVRDSAEQLKRDAFAAVRWWLREDEEVQRALDAIAEGSGDPDLIDDLRRLAALVDAHRPRLKKADLPKKAGEAMRTLADALADATATRPIDAEVAAQENLRNRAYWHLRGLMDEIRAAGRYVFREQPKRLAAFGGAIGFDRTRPRGPARRGEGTVRGNEGLVPRA